MSTRSLLYVLGAIAIAAAPGAQSETPSPLPMSTLVGIDAQDRSVRVILMRGWLVKWPPYDGQTIVATGKVDRFRDHVEMILLDPRDVEVIGGAPTITPVAAAPASTPTEPLPAETATEPQATATATMPFPTSTPTIAVPTLAAPRVAAPTVVPSPPLSEVEELRRRVRELEERVRELEK